MACKMCDNAWVNPLLNNDEDLSYVTVGDFDKHMRMMIRSGDKLPVAIIVERYNEKSGWGLVGDYRPNFCPNCGRDLRMDYVKRKELCMCWNPGHGYPRCEQLKWYPTSCNGDPDKCERREYLGKIMDEE